jgi:hypothetical protein
MALIGKWNFVIRRRDNDKAVPTRLGHLCWEAKASSRGEAEALALERARKVHDTELYISAADTADLSAMVIDGMWEKKP